MRFEIEDIDAGYIELRDAVLAEGREVRPRGMRTLEIPNAQIKLTNPLRPAPTGVGRGLNPKIGAAEAAHLIGGFSDAVQLVNCAKNFGMFVEEDGRLKGAYGPRMYQQDGSYGPRTASQWDRVIETLVNDPDSRQAGVVIWRPWELEVPSKDVPCTVCLFFEIRDGLLEMSTTMRSQDLVWGTPYDLMMFTAVQRAMAHALGIPPGPYYHSAMSLHIYVDRDGEDIAEWELGRDPEFEQPTPYRQAYYDRAGRRPDKIWGKIQHDMRLICGVTDARKKHNELNYIQHEWYRDVLEGTQSGNRLCKRCRYVLEENSFGQDRGHCRKCSRDLKYGLELGEYDRIVANQGGGCAICAATADTTRLVVDHDHSTGEVRGILCNSCNTGLGQFDDSVDGLRAAMRYLSTGFNPPA